MVTPFKVGYLVDWSLLSIPCFVRGCFFLCNKKCRIYAVCGVLQTPNTMFYKGGVTDPDYCVLKFTAEGGRYYCDLKTESFTIE